MPTVVKFPSVKALRTVIKGLSDIVDGSIIAFDKQGLRLLSRDPSFSILCDLELRFLTDAPKYLFDPEHTETQISLVALNCILGEVEKQKDTEELRWTIDCTTDSVIFDRYTDGSIDSYCDRWTLNTINIDEEERVTPAVVTGPVSSHMVISSKYMISTISAFSVFADTDTDIVLFDVDYATKTLTLSSAGANGECRRVLRPTADDIQRIRFVAGVDTRIRANFSLSYLKRFMKSSTVADVVTIYLHKAHGATLMKLEYEVSDFGTMRFLVVSKVCIDDDDVEDDSYGQEDKRQRLE